MANPEVITQFANPDPDAAPLNITQLVQLLNTLISSEILGSYIPYVIQHGTPSVDDRDKAWIFTDTQGRPIEIRTWWDNSGSWRRIYNGMINEVRMYNGDPSIDFDTEGRGNIGGTYDGWHLCNGNNGTPDLSDRFLIAGHMNNAGGHVGYDDGWQTIVSNVDDEHEGGVRDNTLDAGNTYRPAIAQLKVGKWAADSNAHSNTGDMYGRTSNTEDENLVLIPADAGNTEPQSITNIPPFIAIGYIIFVGYQT